MTYLAQENSGKGALPERADAIVVGGGIIGLLAAIELKHTHESVVVLEAATVGCAQSSRHLGFLREQGRNSAETALMRLSQNMWSALAEAIGPDLAWQRGGHISLGQHSTKEADAIAAWGQIAGGAGIPFEELTAEDLAHNHPWLSKHYTFAGFTPADAQLDPVLSLDALASFATSKGIHILEGTAVQSLTLENDRIHGITTARGNIATSTVILATGAWTSRLLRRHGIVLPTHCGVATIAATKPVPPLTRHTVWEVGQLGFRQDQRNRIVFGFGGYARVYLRWEDVLAAPRMLPTYLRSWGKIHLRLTSELFKDFWKVIRRRPLDDLQWHEYPPNWPEAQRGLERLSFMVPSLRGQLVLDEAWSGVIDATADELPAIGHGDIRGLAFAAGLSGHGIGIAPAVARAVVEIATTGTTNVPGIDRLSPSRLRGYQPLRTSRVRARSSSSMTT